MSDFQRNTPDDHVIDKMSHDRYLRTGRSSRSRIKILGLGVTLGVTLLVLMVVSIFSASKISSLSGEKMDLERKLVTAEQEINTLTPKLEKTRTELNDLVQSRFPNLQPLTINNMLEINEGLIKQVVFTKIKQGKQDIYKYLVVVENAAIKKINPSFRVLLFDEFGVHVGSADVVDKRVLEAGESRDYTAELELLFETTPKHFYIEDLSANYSSLVN
jgi:cell division protein FtsL